MVAESALIRHQPLILNRGRKRAPNLRAMDRLATGLLTLLMSPARILRSAIVLKPSTLLHLHNLLGKRKYRMLFSPQRGRRPGPKGPNKTSSTPSWPLSGAIPVGLSAHCPADRPGFWR